ncbi:MAG: dephospho-CoA kinase [Flavobacteriaceae bacterium]
MKLVGLTGGIGSGKTTVAGMFQSLGVPVYNSDDRAKEMMTTSADLIPDIKNLLGDEAYIDGELNRQFIAMKVFSDKSYLDRLNNIVHPAVREDFRYWAGEQITPYVIQEAAILYENEAYKNFDHMILVTAPKLLRLKRVMQRDQVDQDNILARMNHQWEDNKKIPLAHFVIENIELSETASQVKIIHQKLTELSANTEF